MDRDRFWGLIDQARTNAGAAADEAIRDIEADEVDPDYDYWNFDDIDMEEFQATRADLSPGNGTTAATDGKADDKADDKAGTADDDDEDDDDDDGGEEDDLTDPVALALFDLLVDLPAAEIAAFDNQFEDLRALADRADIVNAATLIEHGLLGDDSFEDFRAGLVALGRQTFEATLANPDSLAAHPVGREIAAAHDPRYLGREDLLYVASHAYAAVTGEEEVAFYDFAESVREEATTGQAASVEAWDVTDEAQTRRRLPRLTDLFFDRSMRIRDKAIDKLGLT